MKNIRHIYQSVSGRALLLSLMLLLCICMDARAAGGIVIGGDVYGGGKDGDIGIDNASDEALVKENVKLYEGAETNVAAKIEVYDGTIRTIFGGGQNGRTYGSTSVTIQGAGTVIGNSLLVGTENGGVFGAGDGNSAYVFGHSHVTINGGTINQNVYGGGNKADLMGTTQVKIKGGKINESVFGGSRLANIFGYGLVDIDGTNATEDIVIKAVYGGNDISGTIETSNDWDWTMSTTLKLPEGIFNYADDYGIANAQRVTQYNSFVHSSAQAANKHIFVGQVFGGGNGDYTYNDVNHTVSALGTTFDNALKPEVDRSYIELGGGTFGYVYGGGNDATVITSVDICLDNTTTNLYEIETQLLKSMGVSTDSTFTTVSEGVVQPTYQFDRVFGGNNKATMSIQPKWHLRNATINNLYSGGNEGDMTNKRGLLLVLDQPGITVNTVYGGCRRADVIPMDQGVPVTTIDAIEGYLFPKNHSARVYITAGTINNVYGGNDISGNVVGGNAIDIRSSILGDVYGGGNGSYAYTDNPQLADHEYYRDFYYTIPQGSTSAEALNAFRPNAQQAWIHVSGTEDKPTLIGGSLYCGGNSATLNITENDTEKKARLEIGSYVIVDKVFMGSNGQKMIDETMLNLYENGYVDGKLFNTMVMANDFAKYIEGVSLGIRPLVSFESNYESKSTQIGSFFVGGNLGSITASGKFELKFERPVIIYDKVVAGCNNANYKNDALGIDYQGGITNNAGVGADGVKVKLDIDKITLMPKKIDRDQNGRPRFDNEGKPILVWNKKNDRLQGANIYGGCYASGYINGGVEININGPAMSDDEIFEYTYTDDQSVEHTVVNSGVKKEDQQQDVEGHSMSVFGAGYGEDTQIWGDVAVNIAQNGYILQAFGGGEMGIVGKVTGKDNQGRYILAQENGNNLQYNATINLMGGNVDEIYGGGFEGFVSGNTTVNLYSGNAVDVFGGACNADVGGYASVYIGGDANGVSPLYSVIPNVQNVFGGNDFSGIIGAVANSTGSHTGYNNETIRSNTYVEYLQGEVDSIFGGSYGNYDYAVDEVPPFLESSFVNFKPNTDGDNRVNYVFGGGWGDPSVTDNNKMQQRSYVLVNVPNSVETFSNTDIFGAGAYSGLGMNKTPEYAQNNPADVTAKVVLVGGKVHNVYGASYKGGFTRRTEVIVPSGSTINVSSMFGGGYGDNLGVICDTYESHINYSSADATVRTHKEIVNGEETTVNGAIYGGNNNSRRTIYSFIDINSPVYSNKANGYTAPVYGAGYGADTWTQYTQVNLNNGANVYEVYGGGEGGKVLNLESVNALTYSYVENETTHTVPVNTSIDPAYDADQTGYHGGLNNALVHANRFPLKEGQLKTNTNVYIWKGAQVSGYAYGGGLGETALVSGTTYIGVHGGTVVKDLYAAGTSGAVNKLTSSLTFTPQTYTFVEGGSVRNMYGGGWKGDVGYHNHSVNATTDDIEGSSHVVIGILPEKYIEHEAGYDEPYGFYKGVPTVQRNAYAGGEGGAVYGMANLTMNNGYVGYEYSNGNYVEKIEDDTHRDNLGNLIPNTNLKDSGNIFGGGYKEESDVDSTFIVMMGGTVRNSLYGGGEIATVGRGTKGSGTNSMPTIHKIGKTHVEMFSGTVLHDVFGGGKGYDNLGLVGERLHTDGYVFGSTEVYMYGGVVGSTQGVTEGYGNVFGGGNVGYVYSGSGTKSASDGYYYDSNDRLTEDCRVIVSPYAKVLADQVELRLLDENGTEVANSRKTFYKNEYVPTEYLNSLNKGWIADDKKITKQLDWVSGVNIHNAVFAGGNVSSGSNVLYANTKTVYGNATAALNDVYHCDLITVGTEHIGGLYGDGNLTFVDGYRELNITNYGTDYYGQSDVITLAQYNEMNDRERAYFELKYKCVQECTDNYNKTYNVGASLTEDDLRKNFQTQLSIIDSEGNINAAYWVESGFCSIYAGRLLNTIQRADFVGVFGSRMVMQGARDRVPSVVDYTDYTINRVGEVSLNQNHSRAGDSDDLATLGNYFGIYNIVNHLGSLTSDVDFSDDVRYTKNGESIYTPDRDGQTYEEWKVEHKNDRKRNNGSCANKVALAAGVYLELTTEESTPENKVWGIATGVMELDLINVMPGLGGGYVYAKNVHGVRSNTQNRQITLSKYNEGANSNKRYTYTEDDANAQDIQTSGNFIHSIKQIFDDCYPQTNSFKGADAAPAHYWFIKGQVYVYDQYISAYTGAANAYSKTVNIPLTITAGSHGMLKLQNVQPNKYAYYSTYINENNKTKLAPDASMLANNKTYHLNDTITYWEWSLLSESDQKKFVNETYVTIADCRVYDGSTTLNLPKGYVMLPAEYQALLQTAETKVIDRESVKAVYHEGKQAYVPFTDVLRSSNNISHDNGYILTYDVTNPTDWDLYHSPSSVSTGSKISTKQYAALSDNDKRLYLDAPTYNPTTSNVYGQRMYTKGEVITKDIKDTYESTVMSHLTAQQLDEAAKFERAYVLTKKVSIENEDGTETYLNEGYVMPESEYTAKMIGANGAQALYCTTTWELKRDGYDDNLIYYGQNMTEAQIREVVERYICYQEGTTEGQIQNKTDEIIQSYFTPSYYCTDGGPYGGGWYDENQNYTGLAAWASLPAQDRSNFTFNYDGLDLLIDPQYRGDAKFYDSSTGTSALLYALEKPVDYDALYLGSLPMEYYDGQGHQQTIQPGQVLSRADFEDIPNERYHYAPFDIDDASEHVYIVNNSFIRGDIPYSIGNKIDYETYQSLNSDLKHNIDVISGVAAGKYYYCRDSYTIDNVTGRGTAVTAAITNSGIQQGTRVARGGSVPAGFIIDEGTYSDLQNRQTNFTVYGRTPIVTSTFYVSGQSNIQDLSRGKVITVIYQYNYEESDESGNNIEPITERHVVNIHIQFKSGTPTIGQLGEPSIVLPGSSVGLTTPSVKPGAYEVIGGGWELFASKDEAERHVNGTEFDNVDTKLYWYQNNGYHIAYYAKTYLGKTYSNPVRVKVANYHDLDMVMRDSVHHMYIDNPNVERNSKIYIDANACTSDRNKSKLDLLKDLFDLSLQTITYDQNGEPEPIASGELKNHIPLDDHVKGLANLEFILRSDVAPKKYTTWSPIGNASQGFEGNLHGDGYTISGLDHSLFGNLCARIYNLGVTGSFDGSGIADLGGAQGKVGYAENCWIMTSGTIANGTKAIIGDGGVTRNCYYPDNLNYTAIEGTKAMPMTAFNNGEVTFDLNGFYLTKRYADNNGVNTNAYKYYTIADNSTNTLASTPSTSYYSFGVNDLTYEYADKTNLGYVESRYMDGDFIYASGTIPTTANERRYFVPSAPGETPDPDNGLYYPIWPDDYIFFGQMLTYGYTENVAGRTYQSMPSRINKADRSANNLNQNASNWLLREDLSENSNRVYRAPAYFGNKTPGIIHYNSYVVVPAKTSNGSKNVYPNLTAIDFTAVSDYNNGDQTGQVIWQNGWNGNVFNKRVLDSTPIIAFRSDGQTRNLLVYSESDNDAAILRDYFNEPSYAEIDPDYRNVARVINTVRGHLVMKTAPNTFQADGDQFLVDKQDFNAPISYSFGTFALNDYYHMWYQRMPENYVNGSNGGWETVTLPFTAELVTTQDKGEITHFYSGSQVGHEYWLRRFNTVTQDDKAQFASLAAGSTAKTVNNTFLWDYYYYNVNGGQNYHKDKNLDTYQTYYDEARTYSDYPLLSAGTPYLIGFPGKTYYEFDLSGQFIPENTANTITDLGAQIITFVSEDATTIQVTDDEYLLNQVTDNSTGFTFVPTYQTRTVGDDQTDAFLLATQGTKLVRNQTATTVPFRAYLTGPAQQPSQGAPSRSMTRSALAISYSGDSDQLENVAVDRGLSIYASNMTICIESTLEYPATVTVTSVAGKLLKQFTIQPGTKVTVPVNNRGAYIVNNHKIAVTR